MSFGWVLLPLPHLQHTANLASCVCESVFVDGLVHIQGLIIRTNTFDFSDESIIQLHGEFDSVSDTFIGGNIVSNNMTAVSTSSTRQLHLTNATEWEFDLSDELLFATIQRVQYSLELDDGQPLVRHASRPAKGTHVVVETDVPVSGTVTVWVDQSKMSQMGGLSA
uniref:Uncharacterized protein n=1 Tax=Vitrella brassicaformis TaxID=1169539 RepID=A0A7S1PAL1_9ALVE